ncbi:MAG: HD domain-containing protein [Holophagales bacterium]|jgi:3'-5' exoribonuclease|nr:HD domain-containing protein [Holophagales bacterium]
MTIQIPIKSFKEGDAFTGYLLAQETAFKTSSRGTDYLELTLSDATGRVKAFLWDLRAIEGDIDAIQPDAFLKIKGAVTIFNSRIQLKLDKLRFAPDEEIPDLSAFFPLSDKPVGEMLAELDRFIDSLKDPWLKNLVVAMLRDDKALREAFAKAPAAKHLHHVYLGGLLEHTISVASMAEKACSHYQSMNRDLVIAAALLHDVGKIAELSYDRSFGYTDEGNLLGHISIEVQWVQNAISSVERFPEELRRQFLHILLGHHGKLEFGAPVLPKTPEAILIHYLDDLDGKLESVFTNIREDPGAGNWTQYNKSLERMIYKTRWPSAAQ